MGEAAEAFDGLVSRLDYPMYVVTTAANGERAGCLVGFATQCSIDPPRFLVCVSENNHTHRIAAGATALAVHLIADKGLAELFGSETGDEVDKFARCAWHEGPDGVPVLDRNAGWFAGRVLARHDLGDHTGLLLEPFAGEAGEGGDLVTFDDVRDLTPGHEA